MADESSLKDDEAVPFPHETHMNLGVELMNVFDAEVLYSMKPGSGQMLKGVIQKNLWAVAICKSQEHKSVILSQLRAYMTAVNLV